MRIAIIGLGLTGSSIGLSLKQTAAQFEIIGHDKDHEAARRAAKSGCVDRTDWNLIGACDGAELVVLSIPLAGIKDTLVAIAQDLKPGCVVTDTASLKVPVLNWARESLPGTVHFVGGHPIIEKAVSEPTADLFAKSTYCLTPAANTSPEALQTVSDLVEALGTTPYYLDAAEHDGLIAAVEQLPLLLALALQVMAASSPSIRELSRLSGENFTSIAQLLAGSAENLTDLCTWNSANITRWLDAFQSELATLREFIASRDSESSQKSFAAALAIRDQWSRLDKQAEGEAVNYSDFAMTHMLLGDLFKPRRPEGK